MTRSVVISILFFVILVAITRSSLAQTKVQQKLPEKTRILFVLDGSGSMEGLWDGKQSRMDIAKSILTKLVDSLKVNPELELALRVYGHQFIRAQNNCQDSRLEVPFGLKNHNAIINKIKGITPRGVTPITYSLTQAAKDFPTAQGYRNILILITDGVESCGGDPCTVSTELQKKGVFLRPYVIGLGLKGGAALDCVGKYIDSENANSFNKVLNKSIEASLAKTTVSIELLDGDGKPTETNIDVSFVNHSTGLSAYEFVHYRDKVGRPDSVQVDPVIEYDIVVNTVPQVISKNHSVEPGRHTVISVAAPQGSIVARPEGKGNPFAIVVREKGKGEILNMQRGNEPYRYLAGTYEVETLTFPRRLFTVELKANTLETITLPPAGIANINTLLKGIGSLFEITEKGESVWVCHLDDKLSLHSYDLLPGKYKIAFRTKQAGGSKYTAVKHFEVKPAQTTNVNVFK